MKKYIIEKNIWYTCAKLNTSKVFNFLLDNFEFTKSDIDNALSGSELCDVEIIQLLIEKSANVKKYGRSL